MTPAPMTPRRAGTASNSKAFHESTMYFPSCGTLFSCTGTEPDASTTCFASRVFSVPSAAVTEHLVAGQQAPMALNAHHAVGLEQAAMPPVMVLTTDARRFCMAARSSVSSPILMPWTPNSSLAR